VRPAIVADAVRDCVPVFAPTENVTVPLPLPDPPVEMLNHDDCSDAVHAHPAGDVTANDTGPPARTTDWDVGETANVHGWPAWLTLRVSPAIRSDPLRVVAVGLAAALKVTVPLPLPFEPPVIVIQLTEETADHVHPAGAVTEKVLVLATAPSERLVGETLYVHGTWNVNGFDGPLVADPRGPTAAMRTSYEVPPVGSGLRIVLSASRTFPDVSGAGLPSDTTRAGLEEPAAYSSRSYRWTSGWPVLSIVS
jgi:hypothetical protein